MAIVDPTRKALIRISIVLDVVLVDLNERMGQPVGLRNQDSLLTKNHAPVSEGIKNPADQDMD